MKKIGLVIVLFFIAFATRSDAQGNLMVVWITNSIYAVETPQAYQAAYDEAVDEGLGLFAIDAASMALQRDADNRLLAALNAFASADPDLYQTVMTNYGLAILTSDAK